MKYTIVGNNPYVKIITTVCPFTGVHFVGGSYCINGCESFISKDDKNNTINCKKSREDKLRRILNI